MLYVSSAFGGQKIGGATLASHLLLCVHNADFHNLNSSNLLSATSLFCSFSVTRHSCENSSMYCLPGQREAGVTLCALGNVAFLLLESETPRWRGRGKGASSRGVVMILGVRGTDLSGVC